MATKLDIATWVNRFDTMVVFDLEFDVVSDRTPANINIEYRRNEIFSKIVFAGDYYSCSGRGLA